MCCLAFKVTFKVLRHQCNNAHSTLLNETGSCRLIQLIVEKFWLKICLRIKTALKPLSSWIQLLEYNWNNRCLHSVSVLSLGSIVTHQTLGVFPNWERTEIWYLIVCVWLGCNQTFSLWKLLRLIIFPLRRLSSGQGASIYFLFNLFFCLQL